MGVIVLYIKEPIFSLPGWIGSYIFGYLNAKFQPLRSWITRFLYAGFYCMKTYMRTIYGVKNYIKEDHRNYRRNFCSCEKQKQISSWLPITRALPWLTRTSRHLERKSISPGFPSNIYCNFTLGNSKRPVEASVLPSMQCMMHSQLSTLLQFQLFV